jgi:hypothetical protein
MWLTLPLLWTAAAQAWGPAAARAAATRVGLPVHPAQRPAAGLGGGGGDGGRGRGRGGGGEGGSEETREVRFVPSFRAAHIVEGVEHAAESGDAALPWDALSDGAGAPQPLYSCYNVSARSSLHVVSRLAQGLTRTGQLGAAIALVRAYLELRPPGEAESAAPPPATAAADRSSASAPRAGVPPGGISALPRGMSGGLAEHDEVRLANLVLDACAHHGQMASCDSILDALRRRRLPPSAYTYCILIKG